MNNTNKDNTLLDKEGYTPTLCIFTGRSCSATKTIDQLKQQLADKEKERHEEWLSAKEWKWECDRLKKELHTANQETLHFQNKYFAEKQIAIEELEKLKRELEFTSNNNEWITARDDRILNGVCDCIDQQIKMLKEKQK